LKTTSIATTAQDALIKKSLSLLSFGPPGSLRVLMHRVPFVLLPGAGQPPDFSLGY